MGWEMSQLSIKEVVVGYFRVPTVQPKTFARSYAVSYHSGDVTLSRGSRHFAGCFSVSVTLTTVARAEK